MATFKAYKLHFTAPLHISNQHEDENTSLRTIHSDTLYAALISCLAKAGHSIPQDGDLGFTISSLFPYFQKDENSAPTYFLPIPLHHKQAEIKDFTMLKKVKRVQWVDSSLYGKVLAGKSLFEGTENHSLIQDSYLSDVQLPEDANGSREFVRSEVSQRVTLSSRIGEEDAKPYYIDKILFRHHAGLFFLAEGETTLLDKALVILSSEGIGTDRNVGLGFFDFTTDSITIDLPEKANHQLALSLLIPASKEQLEMLMSSERVAYDFVRRGGWITTYPYMTLRKNAIYGFLPGSVFHKEMETACSTIGKIVNLKPEVEGIEIDHPVWRNGKSIMLPINL